MNAWPTRHGNIDLADAWPTQRRGNEMVNPFDLVGTKARKPLQQAGDALIGVAPLT
jgi:hypothetical protein